jgi:MGT family glycosyltransferase
MPLTAERHRWQRPSAVRVERMSDGPLIALFPEASFGAALNCVALAQSLRDRGARPVFICHPGFSGVFADYGFQEHQLDTGDPLSDVERLNYWQDFIARHLPHFRLPPSDQIETYDAPTWNAIVDTAIAAERPLKQLLSRLRPDAIVLDNVIMFPSVATAGCPWVRMVSCAETELPDPLVPPYLSGLAADSPERSAFEARYATAIAPILARYNRFRDGAGLPALHGNIFIEPSPDLNLLLTPAVVKRTRANLLDPQRYVYLEGCTRTEVPFEAPHLPRNDGPLVYVSFGSLGAMDVALMERLIAVFATLPMRFLVSVGGFRDTYRSVPDNVHLASWYPQPSVVAQAALFIHHGGNNSLCEALTFGVPSLVMPYCWDGHDNARRIEECNIGMQLDRSSWTPAQLEAAVRALVGDAQMQRRLRENAAAMSRNPGRERGAAAILDLAMAGKTAARKHSVGR